MEEKEKKIAENENFIREYEKEEALWDVQVQGSEWKEEGLAEI